MADERPRVNWQTRLERHGATWREASGVAANIGMMVAAARQRVLVAGLLFFASWSGPGAETAVPQAGTGQSPVFRGRIDVASVRVAVIDNRTGRPVTGLAERDFTVLENGLPQTIVAFTPDAPVSSTPAGPVGTTRRRVFLIVIGSGRLMGPVRPFEVVARFIRERLAPDDLVALMAFNRVTAFTADHESIARVVERLQARLADVTEEARRDQFTKTHRSGDISGSLQAGIDRALQAPDGPDLDLRGVVPLLLGTQVQQLNDGEWRPWNRWVIGRDLLKAYAGIEYLRRIEGDRHLICVTLEGIAPPPITFSNAPAGMTLDSREDDARLAARANDARVAVHIIHTIGAQSGAFSIMSSRNVAELSGGYFTGVRTAETAVASIDDATRQGYVIGYTPANREVDGR